MPTTFRFPGLCLAVRGEASMSDDRFTRFPLCLFDSTARTRRCAARLPTRIHLKENLATLVSIQSVQKNAPLGWLGQKNLQNEASYSSDHLGQIGNGSRLIAAEHIRTIGNINPDTLILRTCDRFKRREHGSVGKASIVVENIIIAI